MNKTNLFVGVFISAALALLAAGLFLIGNQHKAFRRHLDLYTEFANVDGIGKGAKVRVNGMDAGQVLSLAIPDKPSSRFRLKLQVEERLHGLIRDNSIVTIETEGIVGDKFLLIHSGDDQAPLAAQDSTLKGKEPFQIGKMLEQASGLINQANATMIDVREQLDGTLQAVTKTVNNTNGVVTDLRRGHGTAGVLLEDPVTAANVKQIVTNSRQVTDNLNVATTRVNDLIQDLQSRKLSARVQQTLDTANGAVQQLDQTSQQLNQAVTRAFAEDQYGKDGGANLQQTLTNVNVATGNLADDTAALKQEFFFRGFFKKRGYDDLDHLPAEPYRSGQLFQKLSQDRRWLPATLFTPGADGKEILSPEGRRELDDTIAHLRDPYATPMIIEGYAASGTPADQLVQSRARAVLVRSYLETHFHIESKDLAIIGLSSTPPAGTGKDQWDGASLVEVLKKKN